MARGRKTSIHVELSSQQKQQLESWLRSTTQPAGLVRRTRIIVMLARGDSISHISRTARYDAPPNLSYREDTEYSSQAYDRCQVRGGV